MTELLLHPRVPPLVRSLPHVEMLSLFRAEEGEEEMDVRKRVGLMVLAEPVIQPDVAERLTPHVEQSNTSNTPRNLPEAERNTGSSAAQELELVSMQVDVPPARTPAVLPHLAQLQQSIQLQAAPILTVHRSDAHNPLPPPPESLSSSSTVLRSPLTVAAIPSTTASITPTAVPTGDEEDEDEPMPTIDLGSDSDSE